MSKQEINLMFFTGFYESIHGSVFDHEIDYIIEDAKEDNPALEYDDFIFTYDRLSYAQRCVHAVNSQTGLKLSFLELIQPREYNFTTDKIICTITKKDINKIKSALNTEYFDNLVKERFTSRSGFISFYSNNVREWKAKKLSEWDSVELGTLLDAWLYEQDIKDLDFDCYDYCQGNGQYVNYDIVSN